MSMYEHRAAVHVCVYLSSSLQSWDYPEADFRTRQRIISAHIEHSLGLIHFLRTDPAVSRQLQEEMREWGFCADEFADEQHFPTSSLYVPTLASQWPGWCS
jgi:hypothetical protein